MPHNSRQSLHTQPQHTEPQPDRLLCGHQEAPQGLPSLRAARAVALHRRACRVRCVPRHARQPPSAHPRRCLEYVLKHLHTRKRKSVARRQDVLKACAPAPQAAIDDNHTSAQRTSVQVCRSHSAVSGTFQRLYCWAAITAHSKPITGCGFVGSSCGNRARARAEIHRSGK